jgi:hypothetical protein
LHKMVYVEFCEFVLALSEPQVKLEVAHVVGLLGDVADVP